MAEVKQIGDLTFEQALAELEEIVRGLETGNLPLEESLALFERGQAVAAYCNSQLDQAELRIKLLTPDGEVPFEPAR